MKMSTDDIEIIKQEYTSKYDFQCSDDNAKELLEFANGDTAMVVKTIGRTDKHYKLKEFIESNAKKKIERKEKRNKRDSAYVEQLKYMYEPFLSEGVIDETQYNAIIAQRQGLPHSKSDYQQGMFFVQKNMYKHPIQWVNGLGLTMWEKQAFDALIPEQQERFDYGLIKRAAVKYRQKFVLDESITPETIMRTYGVKASLAGK